MDSPAGTSGGLLPALASFPVPLTGKAVKGAKKRKNYTPRKIILNGTRVQKGSGRKRQKRQIGGKKRKQKGGRRRKGQKGGRKRKGRKRGHKGKGKRSRKSVGRGRSHKTLIGRGGCSRQIKFKRRR